MNGSAFISSIRLRIAWAKDPSLGTTSFSLLCASGVCVGIGSTTGAFFTQKTACLGMGFRRRGMLETDEATKDAVTCSEMELWGAVGARMWGCVTVLSRDLDERDAAVNEGDPAVLNPIARTIKSSPVEEVEVAEDVGVAKDGLEEGDATPAARISNSSLVKEVEVTEDVGVAENGVEESEA
jgi:hypothetical protein